MAQTAAVAISVRIDSWSYGRSWAGSPWPTDHARMYLGGGTSSTSSAMRRNGTRRLEPEAFHMLGFVYHKVGNGKVMGEIPWLLFAQRRHG